MEPNHSSSLSGELTPPNHNHNHNHNHGHDDIERMNIINSMQSDYNPPRSSSSPSSCINSNSMNKKRALECIESHGMKKEKREEQPTIMASNHSPLHGSCTSSLLFDIDNEIVKQPTLSQVIVGSIDKVLSPCHENEYHHIFDDDMPKCGSLPEVWNPPHANIHNLPLNIAKFKVSSLRQGLICKHTWLNQAPLHHFLKPYVYHANEDDVCSNKLSHDLQGQSSREAAHSPWMSFSLLLHALRKKLPTSDIVNLQQHVKDFQARRTTRKELIAIFRMIVGDVILIDVLTILQDLHKFYNKVIV